MVDVLIDFIVVSSYDIYVNDNIVHLKLIHCCMSSIYQSWKKTKISKKK